MPCVVSHATTCLPGVADDPVGPQLDAVQFEMRDAAVAGGAQRLDGHPGITGRDNENLGARIGFGGNKERVGDGAVG